MLRGNLDEFYYIDPLGRNMDPAGAGVVPEGTVVYVRGWAFFSEPERAAASIVARIDDDGDDNELAYNQDRPDVAQALSLERTRTIGFHGVCSLAGIARGAHVMSFLAVDPESGLASKLDSTLEFETVSSGHAFPYTHELQGSMAIAPGWLRNAETDLEPIPGTVLQLERGEIGLAGGWAIDLVYRTAASDIYACIDKSTFVRGIVGRARPDAAEALEIPEAWRCGFIVRVPTAELEPGRHLVQIRAVAADGGGYEISTDLTLEVG